MAEGVVSPRVITERAPVEIREWRDGHTRVWMTVREVELTDASGATEVQEIPGYIAEKANNLMYEEGGEFQESVAEFEAKGGDFAADKNCFQLYVGGQLSKPVGCFADDALLELRAKRLAVMQANQVWVLSETNKQIAGQMDPSDSSTVIFPSALGNNDLQYRIFRGGFEQRLILNSPPNTPEGCDLRRAFLCVETEVSLDWYLRQTGAAVRVGEDQVHVPAAPFSTTPAQRDGISLVSTYEDPDGKLVELAVHTFGESRVFENSGGQPGRETLAEKVLYRSSEDGKVYLLERVPLAFFVGARYPVVWDYVDRVVSKQGSIAADEIWDPRFTYRIIGPLSVQAKLTILPGTTVKIKPKEGANEPGIAVSGSSGQIIARGEPWFWITFTKESDSNSGEPVTSPVPGSCLYAIRLLFNSSRQSEVSFCKFGYGGKGFWSEVDALANPVRNSVFYSCGAGVYLWNSQDVSTRNNLFASCGRAIYPDGTEDYGKVIIANNTVDYSSYGVFLHIPGGSAQVFDNVLTSNAVGVYLETGSAWVDYNCYYGNTVNTQGVNDGGHSIDDYDMTGSPYDDSVPEVGAYYLNNNQNQGALLKDAGFESASEAGLSADPWTLNYPYPEEPLSAATFTVNAPQYAPTWITTSTTWDPVDGDKGAVDLGYHHNRVDYLLSSSLPTYVTGANAQLTLTPGLVLATGTSSNSRLHVQNSGKLICAGDPTNATYNVITPKKALSMHIESPRFGDQHGQLLISSSASDGCRLKFTKFRWLYQVVTYRGLTESVDGNEFLLSPVGASAARQNSTFLSNLFWGNTKGLYFTDGTKAGDQNNGSAYNNTFDCNEYGFYVYTRNTQPALITVKDSLFTNNGYGIYGDTSGGSSFSLDYNGYYGNGTHIWINGQSVDPRSDPDNVLLDSSPYCTTWRDPNDRWYALDPSPLKDKGSRYATDAGLAERVTVWKDPLQKDIGTSWVDIGYHYPWADIVVHPYLQNLRTDRITVMWWTAAPCLGAVKFTPSGGSEICVTDPVAQRVHEVTLWKLAADTAHTYYVESGPQRRPSQDKGSLSFTTAPETPPDKFRFVVYGDNRGSSGQSSYHQREHRNVVSTMLDYSDTPEDPVRFVVHVADFAYNGGHNYEWNPQFFGPAQMTQTQYQNPATAEPERSLIGRIAIFPSLGNHEYSLDSQADNYRRYFSLPNNERWYSFNFANCHFVILDVENSEWYDDPTDPQRVWLDADLYAAQNDGNIDWVFIVFHKPAYCYGGPHPPEAAIQHNLVPVFESHSKVICVFSGHNHYYQRCLKPDIDYVITPNPIE